MKQSYLNVSKRARWVYSYLSMSCLWQYFTIIIINTQSNDDICSIFHDSLHTLTYCLRNEYKTPLSAGLFLCVCVLLCCCCCGIFTEKTFFFLSLNLFNYFIGAARQFVDTVIAAPWRDFTTTQNYYIESTRGYADMICSALCKHQKSIIRYTYNQECSCACT